MKEQLDIVARLRVLNHHAKKLAENESLHDLYRDAFTRCENLTWEAADEIKRLRQLVSETEKLRQERDSARLHVCALRHVIGQGRTMDEYAKEYGWELPKEEEDEQ